MGSIVFNDWHYDYDIWISLCQGSNWLGERLEVVLNVRRPKKLGNWTLCIGWQACAWPTSTIAGLKRAAFGHDPLGYSEWPFNSILTVTEVGGNLSKMWCWEGEMWHDALSLRGSLDKDGPLQVARGVYRSTVFFFFFGGSGVLWEPMLSTPCLGTGYAFHTLQLVKLGQWGVVCCCTYPLPHYIHYMESTKRGTTSNFPYLCKNTTC